MSLADFLIALVLFAPSIMLLWLLLYLAHKKDTVCQRETSGDTESLQPCLCGNFGDNGPDDYCNRPCETDGHYHNETEEK